MTLPDTSPRPTPDPTAPKVDGRPPTVAPRPDAPTDHAPALPPAVTDDVVVEPEVAAAESPAVTDPPAASTAPPVDERVAPASAAPEPVVEPARAEPPPTVEPEVAGGPEGAVEPEVAEPVAEEPVVDEEPVGIPDPPCPPFAPAAAPYLWQLSLPGDGAHPFSVRIGDDRISIDGVDIAFDQIVDAELGIEKDKATVTRRKAASTYLALTLRDGQVITGAARDVGRSSGRIESVVAATVYLWAVLGSIPAIRERRGIEEKLRRGTEISIGHMRITAIGVAWKRNPIATWSSLGTPTLRGTDMIVPTEGEPLVVPLDVDDAFMLPTLIPELRRCFG